MTNYQDVVTADLSIAAWALTEAAGLTFAPYIGGSNLVGSGTFLYQQGGPFAASESLHMNVGAKATLTFVATVSPPITEEGWFKLSNAAPASSQFLMYNGNSGANGAGLLVNAAGHIVELHGGVTSVDTGLVWPDTNWHLVQRIAAADGTTVSVGFDGQIRYRKATGAPASPSPNVLVFGGDSGTSATQGINVAFPAFYAYEMTAANVAASYLAATNPSAALAATVTAGGGVAGSNTDLLNQILAAVRKTFPRT